MIAALSKFAAMTGLTDASAAIYQRHAPAILAHVRARVPSVPDAEDIVVETFLAALENASFLQFDASAQTAWLFRVAQRKIVDYFRRAQRQPNVALDAVAEALVAETGSPEAAVLRREEQEALHAALQQLTPEQQTLLRLRFAEGQRCADIAATLGKREDAVRKMLSRTLNQLRDIYSKQ